MNNDHHGHTIHIYCTMRCFAMCFFASFFSLRISLISVAVKRGKGCFCVSLYYVYHHHHNIRSREMEGWRKRSQIMAVGRIVNHHIIPLFLSFSILVQRRMRNRRPLDETPKRNEMKKMCAHTVQLIHVYYNTS